LYNRRHFGVLTFFVVLLHASFMVEWYAVQNALPSLYDELTKVPDYGKFIGFPFKALGLVALLILFLMAATSHDYWLVFLTPPVSIPDKGARIVAAPDGERIAVFRDGTQIGAFSNLCAHQHGPIGEGRIIDGCVTCPWHGYQYRLKDGCAPPPFTEKLVTYRV